jgi:hypothetical protein
MRGYLFDLVCPRCSRTSRAMQTTRAPSPHMQCGDCLMDDVEVVEFKVVKVEKIDEIVQG